MFPEAEILPVDHNWSRPLITEWAFRTEVFKARNGTEYRRAEREKPRRRVELDVLLKGDAVRDFRNVLALRNGEIGILPDLVSAVLLDSAPTTASVIPKQFPTWMRAGRPVILYRDSGRMELRFISSVRNGVLAFVEPVDGLTAAWKVMPALYGRLAENGRNRRPTTSVLTASVDFQEEPTSAPDPVDYRYDFDDLPTYRNVPVLAVKPNWRSALEEDFQRPRDVLDFDYGAIDTFFPEADARLGLRYSFLAKDRSITDFLVDFFCRQKGRRGEFYVPTWTDDLRVIRYDGDDVAVFAGKYPALLFGTSFMYRNVCFYSPSGLVIRGIRAVVLEEGNSKIYLDAPVSDTSVLDVRVSWFLRVRFAADILSVTWHTNTVAEFDIAVTSLLDHFYEWTINGLPITFGGDYATLSPVPRPKEYIPVTFSGEETTVFEDFIAL